MSEAKDAFLATLSHELRTPLNAILGWAQVLRTSGRSPEDVRRGLETIERNARVQTQLIGDLLDMSRITAGKLRLELQPMHPYSCLEAAVETVQPAAAAKGVRLERVLDPSAGPILGDPARAGRRRSAGRARSVALTAFARTEDRSRALRAGFLVHVSKPVDASELVATVASVARRGD